MFPHGRGPLALAHLSLFSSRLFSESAFPQVNGRTRASLNRVHMLVRAVFWTVLAGLFFALAIVAWRERKKVREKTYPALGHDLVSETSIMQPVADSLTSILRVEAIGFALAAVAALYEVFT